MAGRVLRALPKTFVTFTPNTLGQAVTAAQTMTTLMVRRFDISQFREVTIYARLHTPSTIGDFTTATFPTIVVYADGYTNEDPSPANAAGTAGVPSGFLAPLTLAPATGSSIAFGQTTTSPVQLLVMGLPANAGGLIAIGISCKQVAAASKQADLYVSIDVSGKE